MLILASQTLVHLNNQYPPFPGKIFRLKIFLFLIVNYVLFLCELEEQLASSFRLSGWPTFNCVCVCVGSLSLSMWRLPTNWSGGVESVEKSVQSLFRVRAGVTGVIIMCVCLSERHLGTRTHGWLMDNQTRLFFFCKCNKIFFLERSFLFLLFVLFVEQLCFVITALVMRTQAAEDQPAEMPTSLDPSKVLRQKGWFSLAFFFFLSVLYAFIYY